jgi:ubiquinone/menaquinone biosynthesis C-methylase UbiE
MLVNHADHVNVLHGGVPGPGGIWADLGSGAGAFTLALAELIEPAGQIHSVDRDRRALREQERMMRGRFPDTAVIYHTADFTELLELPLLDGVLMANALHFQPPPVQEAVVRQIHAYLRPGGRLIVVEYDTDQGNPWVPYPLSFSTWQALAERCGFAGTTLLAGRPSRFLGRIYAAVSIRTESI